MSNRQNMVYVTEDVSCQCEELASGREHDFPENQLVYFEPLHTRRTWSRPGSMYLRYWVKSRTCFVFGSCPIFINFLGYEHV